MTDTHEDTEPRFPELIDIPTLAAMLGVREPYVRRMVAERRVPTVKLGHLVRFDLAEVRRWLETQRRPGGPMRDPDDTMSSSHARRQGEAR